MKNNGFVFYSSFYECIKTLEDNDKLKIFEAICEYGIYGKKKKISTKAGAIMELIIPQIEASAKRYNAQVENGKKGGAPKGNSNAKKTTENNPKTTQNNLKVDFENNPKTSAGLNLETTQNNLKYKYNDKYKYNNKYNIKSNQRENNLENNSGNNLDDKVDTKRQDKINFYLEVLEEKTNKLSDDCMSTQTKERLKSLFLLISQKESFNMQGFSYSTDKILESLVNLFVGTTEEVQTRIEELFNKIDNAPNIKNKLNYTVSVLFDKSRLVISNCC